MNPNEWKYLRGEMPVCNNVGCDRPSQDRDAGYCTRCWIRIQQDRYADELKEAKNAPIRSWYFIPKHFRRLGAQVFVCLTCECTYDVDYAEIMLPAKTNPATPIIGCCVQTEHCAAAKAFWGDSNPIPAEMLKSYERCPFPYKSGIIPAQFHRPPDDLSVVDQQLYTIMHDAARRYKGNPKQAIADAAKINALTQRAIADVAAGR
jgi:hypothetical protein